MLKAFTLLSLLVGAPAFAAADNTVRDAGRAGSPLAARSTDRGARVAEAAAWQTLTRGLMRASGGALMNPDRSFAALAMPDLAGEVAHALQSH